MRDFNQKKQLTLKDNRSFTIHDINAIEKQDIAPIGRLPFSIRILLENLLRNYDKYNGKIVKEDHVLNVAKWKPIYHEIVEIPFFPYRVVMQDLTGVPAVVDLASMRDAMKTMGQNPQRINPVMPVDIVIDHSVQVDFYGSDRALQLNLDMENLRNKERFSLLKWAQKSFDNFRVFPPGAGIVHQVNLEYLSRVVVDGDPLSETDKNTAFPDTLIGADSHTPMVNGIGVVGWGVGGIEAESTMLGQPTYIKIPEVVGFKLTGHLSAGVSATDLVLTITQILRKENVVEKFVEYFGPGMKELSVPDRATIGNMAPEYGATIGFFPVDEKVLDYLALTGREDRVELVDTYTRTLGLFYTGNENPEYTKVLELDLSTVEPTLAGPTKPHERVPLRDIKTSFENALQKFVPGPELEKHKEFPVKHSGETNILTDSSVVISAITSCTNTSNPRLMVGAGLLAKKAVEKGLQIKKYVKTSFAPGSRAVTGYLEKLNLWPYFDKLGYNLVGYGCTTCIGNSGPFHPQIEKTIRDQNLATVAILSGNRNYEARIHQLVKANYLASPLLVVAFGLAGRIDFDMYNEPLGTDPNGTPVFLKDIWPTPEEIDEGVAAAVTPEIFREKYQNILEGDKNWLGLPAAQGKTYAWDENSTYIKRAPFFDNFSTELPTLKNIENARVLLALGDTVTTDHISPAGEISDEYPAGKCLLSKKVEHEEFNSYGSRRGNHEIMMRGTFANPRIKNKLVAPKEGGFTMTFPDREVKFVYDAAEEYMSKGIPLIIIGGKEYGAGSSRDWAAKGTLLLGVRAVIAQSYERIHRSNLIGMGVLPLEFEDGNDMESLGLAGSEIFSITGIDSISPGKLLNVTAVAEDGNTKQFNVKARLDTEIDVEYYKNNGILSYVLRARGEARGAGGPFVEPLL